MSVEFILNRESHLTMTSQQYYTEIRKVVPTSQESLVIGDVVLLKTTSGSYRLCVVTSLEPFRATQYYPISYVKEGSEE